MPALCRGAGCGARSDRRRSEKDNIEKDELVALKRLAVEMLAYDVKTLALVLALGVLVEVRCDEKTVS